MMGRRRFPVEIAVGFVVLFFLLFTTISVSASQTITEEDETSEETTEEPELTTTQVDETTEEQTTTVPEDTAEDETTDEPDTSEEEETTTTTAVTEVQCIVPAQDMYNPVQSCSAVAACFSSMCDCYQGTVQSGACVLAQELSACSTAYDCVGNYTKCLHDIVIAPDFSASNCTVSLLDLNSTLASVAISMVLYNESHAQEACESFVCNAIRDFASDSCFTGISYESICVTPFTIVAKLTFDGNWSWVFANNGTKAAVRLAIQKDLTDKLRFICTIISMIEGSLIVQFEVQVSPTNSIFQAAFEQATEDTSWLVNTMQVAEDNSQPTNWTITLEQISATTTAVSTSSSTTSSITTTARPTHTPFPVEFEEEKTSTCGYQCLLYVVGGGTVVIVLIILYCGWRSRKRDRGLEEETTTVTTRRRRP